MSAFEQQRGEQTCSRAKRRGASSTGQDLHWGKDGRQACQQGSVTGHSCTASPTWLSFTAHQVASCHHHLPAPCYLQTRAHKPWNYASARSTLPHLSGSSKLGKSRFDIAKLRAELETCPGTSWPLHLPCPTTISHDWRGAKATHSGVAIHISPQSGSHRYS